jgi:hypothetical protein
MSSNIRKPTVVGEGKLKPTVVGKGQSKPTTIVHAEDVSVTAPKTIAPTTIRPGAPSPTVVRKPTAAASEHAPADGISPIKKITPIIVHPIAPPPPKVVTKPTAMAGVVRKGIEVTAAELKKKFPGDPLSAIDRAIRILQGVIVDKLTPISCSQWGVDVQRQYESLARESVRLTTSSAVQDGLKHMERLQIILKDIADSLAPQSSGFHLWGKQKNALELYHGSETELHQLRDHLQDILPSLRETQKKLGDISTKSTSLIDETNAQCIAIQYVEELLGDEDERTSHLTSQRIALLKTIANMKDGVMLRRSISRDIDSLADRIQDSVLVALPGWIDKLMLAFQAQRTVTETERYTLYEGIKALINKS